MSKRDGGKRAKYARMWFVVYNVVLLLALILALSWAAVVDIRDLQRRVGQLEEQVK